MVLVTIIGKDRKSALKREFGRIRRFYETLSEDEVLEIQWGTKEAFELMEKSQPEICIEKIKNNPPNPDIRCNCLERKVIEKDGSK